MPSPRSSPLPRKTSIQAVRTRKANNRAAAKQSNAAALGVAEKRLAAVELRIQNYSIVDIANALHVSPGRVSQLIGEAKAERQMAIAEAAESLIQLELDRIDKMILAWFQFAKRNTKAAHVLLRCVERRHKLLGLDAVAADRGRALDRQKQSSEPLLDLSRLNDEELRLLDELMLKAAATTG